MIRPSYTYRVLEVLSIYDGDTMTVRVDLGFHISTVVKLRLVGIDTPEMSTPGGKPARDHLRSLCVGDDIAITTFRDPGDKYGRWLAELWVASVNINDRMIRDGHAVAYHGGTR